MAKERGAYMAKEGAGKCLHGQIGGKGERLRAYGQRRGLHGQKKGAYMAKGREGSASLFGHPHLWGLSGQKKGRDGPLWPKVGATWPKERLALLWPSPTGGAHPRPLPSLAKGRAPLTGWDSPSALWERAAAPSLRPERGAFGHPIANGEGAPLTYGRAPLYPYGQGERLAKSMGVLCPSRWPKEKGSDFAGHRMAKKSDPTTWPKGRGCGNFFSALTPTTILEWGELIFEPFR